MPNSDQPKPATTKTIRLLRTKLFVPRTHPDRVERPRLTQRLDEGLACKLVLITAPPGFGKTTLLADWLGIRGETRASEEALHPSSFSAIRTSMAIHPSRAAWLSLDGQDNDPLRFWSYLIAALQTCEPGVGNAVLPVLSLTRLPPIQNLLTELINDLALIQGDLVLVLDDYHVIENEAIHAGVTFLVENLPSPVHLVIASRTEPPLPLPRWRARRALVEFSPADLRFTPDEAAAFLNRIMELDLSASDITALEQVTEGWIAGLQLAALSMQGMRDRTGFIHSFAGSHRYVFDYLAQEVLNRLPEEVQSFLLQTSVLDRFSASLADAVLARPGSQGALERLEQSNLFLVPLDQQRQWYRYHHLFADFLRARLGQAMEPAGIAMLHQRASRWYEQNGLASEAVSHALAAGELDWAAHLIGKSADGLFGTGDLATLLRWLAAFPPDRMRADPALSMIFAWALLATSQFDAVESHLTDIEKTLGARADGSAESMALSAEIRGAFAEVLCIRANLAFHKQDLARVLMLSRHASAYLGDDVTHGLYHPRSAFESVVSFNMGLAYEFSGNDAAAVNSLTEALASSRRAHNLALVQMASGHLAQLRATQGKLGQAAEIYREAIELTAAHTSPVSGILYTGLGNISYEWNDLEQAREYLTRGIEWGKQWSNWETLLPGYWGLALIHAAQGKIEEALNVLDEAAAVGSNAPGKSLLDALRARLWTRQGKKEAAERWADDAAHAFEQSIPLFQEMEAITLAQVLLDLGKLDAVSHLAARIQAVAEAGERWGHVIPVLVVQAQALHQQGRTAEALSALSRALELAEPGGYVRAFEDCKSQIADLRLQTEKQEPHSRLAYMDKLLAAFSDSGAAVLPKSETLAPHAHSLATPARAVVPRTQVPGSAGVLNLPSEISARELQVLRLLADGLTNQEIAERLVISLNTVKTHVKNIHGKLGTRNRTEATTRARDLGLL